MAMNALTKSRTLVRPNARLGSRMRRARRFFDAVASRKRPGCQGRGLFEKLGGGVPTPRRIAFEAAFSRGEGNPAHSVARIAFSCFSRRRRSRAPRLRLAGRSG